MDRILINDLLTRCIIGVNPEERRDKQDVVINITLGIDLRRPAQTDDLYDTVDYSALKKRIIRMVENSTYHLLEALTTHIIDYCFAEPTIQQVRVTVEKPTALRFARSVGVEITRERTEREFSRAFIGVGANINPEPAIRAALQLLRRYLSISNISTFYRTPPIAEIAQADYYNGVLKVSTDLLPETLKFAVLQRIEDELGRQRGSDKNAARVIDLDLLLHGTTVTQSEFLTLPHPDILRRAFITEALCELDQNLTLPGDTQLLCAKISAIPCIDMLPLPEFTEQLRKDLSA